MTLPGIRPTQEAFIAQPDSNEIRLYRLAAEQEHEGAMAKVAVLLHQCEPD